MHLSLKIALAVFLSTTSLATLAAQSEEKSGANQPSSFREKSSYSVGFDIGRNLVADQMDLDLNAVVQGLRDAVEGKPHQLNETELKAVMTVYMQQLEKKQIERWQALSRENLRKGEVFLQKNRTADGVKQLESGLQFKVIEAGTGASPKTGDQVTAHVRTLNVDGVELDSSYRLEKPLHFNISDTPPGWSEALQRMRVGSKWTLYSPAELAYGAEGFAPLVGPNEALVFEIELVAIGPEDKLQAQK